MHAETPTKRPIPPSGSKPYVGRVLSAEFLEDNRGNVGIFIIIDLVIPVPPPNTMTAIVHMIPARSTHPGTAVAAGLELMRFGLTKDETLYGDVPALLR